MVFNMCNSSSLAKLVISDLTGKIISEFSLLEGVNYIEISNQLLHPGVYICHVNSNQLTGLNKQFIVIE